MPKWWILVMVLAAMATIICLGWFQLRYTDIRPSFFSSFGSSKSSSSSSTFAVTGSSVTASAMKKNPDNVPKDTCPPTLNNHGSPCWIQGCNASFLPLQERLPRLLQTQYPITTAHRRLIDNLVSRPIHVDIVFVTAASSNHFKESQGLIRDLHRVVFPVLRRQGNITFHFYYHDLGLNQNELEKLKRFCNCTVISFPFERLPSQFRKLGTCIWKPLLIKAHLRFSRFTFWMDASIRFPGPSGNISAMLEQTQQLGMLLARSQYMLPKHTHPAMLTYFQIQPCLLASFYEIAGTFVALHNDAFVQKAIVDPWVACAFSPNCLYPSADMPDYGSYLPCKVRKGFKYFQCHRFDQSALGIILALLFDWKRTSMVHALGPNDRTAWFAIRRENKVKYFP